jgi:hypothetical protein
MKQILLAMSCVAAAAITGCQSIPQAGLVYVSKVHVGLAASVAPASSTEPFTVHIGFGSSDIAYVPLAVAGSASGPEGKNSIEKIWSSHDELSSPECRAVRKTQDKNTIVSSGDCETRRDAMSVYGQFDGKTTADVNGKKFDLSAGRVFATGVAAQQITEGNANAVAARCVEAVKSALGADAKADVVLATLKLYCKTSGI